MCLTMCVIYVLLRRNMGRSGLSERDRLKIITYRYDFQYSQREIAKKIKCSQRAVAYILKQHIHHHDSPQFHLRGRKKKLSATQQNHLKNIIRENNNLTAAEIQRHFFHHDNIQISLASIKRYRRIWFHPAKEILVPRLNLGHYLARVDYCMSHSNDNFHRVVFSDEKLFKLSHTSSTVWIEHNEPIPVRELSSTHTQVMIWGGIWYYGRTELCIVRGNINHKKYMDILKQYLLPSMPSSPGFLFMHDNATPHNPILVEKMLYDFGVRLLHEYPANSPDLNPIEHVWSWMANYINGHRPTDRRSLITLIQKAWKEIPQCQIQAYIDDLPARLQAVEKAGGARL